MGDDFFFFIKDMLIVRPPIKSSLVLRISVVAFVMVCGICMCSIGLKQISSFTKAGFVDNRIVERPCVVPNVESWESPYVHFPKPTTFSRNKGILFVPIDQTRPLSDKGPLDIVLHKLLKLILEWRKRTSGS